MRIGGLLNRLCKLYTDAKMSPSCQNAEIVSAVLNGAGYQRYQDNTRRRVNTIIKLPERSVRQASLLCNHIVITAHLLREEAIGVARLECIKCKVPVTDDDQAIN